VPLPIKDLPVATVTESEQDLPTPELSRLLRSRLEAMEQWGVLALPGWQNPDYAQVTRLADAISAAVGTLPCRIALRWDMAKALGHALALRLPEDSPCLCLDGLELAGQCYLDVGNPVGPAYPVVIKTLVF
jgi:ethanolamine utilization protein EutA (predicted chaperonin)